MQKTADFMNGLWTGPFRGVYKCNWTIYQRIYGTMLCLAQIVSRHTNFAKMILPSPRSGANSDGSRLPSRVFAGV